jgi:hypothetical protein
MKVRVKDYPAGIALPQLASVSIFLQYEMSTWGIIQLESKNTKPHHSAVVFMNRFSLTESGYTACMDILGRRSMKSDGNHPGNMNS